MSQSILIVEDEPLVSSIMHDYLLAAGFSPYIIDNGKLVVDWLKSNKPALLLLDLMLPGKNGIDICKELVARVEMILRRTLPASSPPKARAFSFDDGRELVEKSVDRHVKKLRKKLVSLLSEQKMNHSIYGAGYRFEWPE